MTLAEKVAAEHCAWERQRGRASQEVLAEIGANWASAPTWDDVQRAVARVWNRLTGRLARRAQE